MEKKRRMEERGKNGGERKDNGLREKRNNGLRGKEG